MLPFTITGFQLPETTRATENTAKATAQKVSVILRAFVAPALWPIEHLLQKKWQTSYIVCKVWHSGVMKHLRDSIF